jgi:hypothetical protein
LSPAGQPAPGKTSGGAATWTVSGDGTRHRRAAGTAGTATSWRRLRHWAAARRVRWLVRPDATALPDALRLLEFLADACEEIGQ